jgi:hypothetical protein
MRPDQLEHLAQQKVWERNAQAQLDALPPIARLARCILWIDESTNQYERKAAREALDTLSYGDV